MHKEVAIAIIVIAVVALGIAYYLLIQHDNVAAEYNVGLGIEFNTHATPVWVALHDGLFMEHGINVTDVLKFRTGLELSAAMARGDVNAGWACLGPALLIIDKGIPVRIVAKVHNYGYELVVNPDKVKDIKDLNSTVVYAPGKGSPCYLLLLKIEEAYNIKFKEIKFMRPSNMLSALLSGEIYAAALPEHYASVAASKGMRILVRSQDVWPDMPGSFLIASEELIKNNPDLVRKLIEVTNEGLSKITKDPSYVAEVDSEALGIGTDIAQQSISMLEWNTTIDLNQIQEYIDFMYNHGLLHNHLNASEIVAEVSP